MTDEADRTEAFTMVRRFAAPRGRLFAAWTEAAQLRRWWGPKGFKVHHCAVDPRPGGVFHYGLTAPDGTTMWGRWVFREVLAPERLVFVSSFSDPAGGVVGDPWGMGFPREVLTTVRFVDHGEATEIVMTTIPIGATQAEAGVFGGLRDSMRQGWGGTFDQLADHLFNPKEEAS